MFFTFLLCIAYFLVCFNLQGFESSLAKKENYLKELEKELCQLKDVNNRLRDEIEHLNDKLVNEARRMKSLERDSDRLRSEISLLESRVLSCSTQY